MSMNIFEKIKDMHIKASFYEHEEHFTVEELYQAFEKRLLDRLNEARQKQIDIMRKAGML